MATALLALALAAGPGCVGGEAGEDGEEPVAAVAQAVGGEAAANQLALQKEKQRQLALASQRAAITSAKELYMKRALAAEPDQRAKEQALAELGAAVEVETARLGAMEPTPSSSAPPAKQPAPPAAKAPPSAADVAAYLDAVDHADPTDPAQAAALAAQKQELFGP